MSAVNKQSSKTSALYLVRTYCLSTLMYGWEARTLTLMDDSLHQLHTARNNITVFDEYFYVDADERRRRLQFFCNAVVTCEVK